MHKKDFDIWNTEKKDIDKRSPQRLFFREREIWWCSLGVNIGFEQDGKNEQFERPVLILKKFNGEMVFIVPLTSIKKTGRYYHSIQHEGNDYSLILSQSKLISTRRLLRKIRTISKTDFLNSKNNFLNLFQ